MSVLDKPKEELNIQAIIDKIEKTGAISVEASFDGSGDEGHIHQVSAFSPKANWESDIELDNELVSLIEEWVLARLEETNIDWYNNDGGFGNYTISKKSGVWRYEFIVNTRYTQVDCEHHEHDVVLIPSTADGEE